jgi:hypothetical protein
MEKPKEKFLELLGSWNFDMKVSHLRGRDPTSAIMKEGCCIHLTLNASVESKPAKTFAWIKRKFKRLAPVPVPDVSVAGEGITIIDCNYYKTSDIETRGSVHFSGSLRQNLKLLGVTGVGGNVSGSLKFSPSQLQIADYLSIRLNSEFLLSLGGDVSLLPGVGVEGSVNVKKIDRIIQLYPDVKIIPH